MLAIIGTVPDAAVPITVGPAELIGEEVVVAGRSFAVNRGTPALLAAAIATGGVLGLPPPMAYLVGDIGLGDGSRRLYAHLAATLPACDHELLVFHYLQPDVDWHGRVLLAIGEMRRRPLLVADAGYMYVAKMSGQAEDYDLFTPDVGELSFLADDQAPHPFYTRGFLLHMDGEVPEMIARAYRHGNAARHLLVKGKRDYVACSTGILAEIAAPSVATMEPVGGTGDTLTGIVAALVASRLPIPRAAEAAARINRLAGAMARPTPATQVGELIACIAPAVAQALPDLGLSPGPVRPGSA